MYTMIMPWTVAAYRWTLKVGWLAMKFHGILVGLQSFKIIKNGANQ